MLLLFYSLHSRSMLITLEKLVVFTTTHPTRLKISKRHPKTWTEKGVITGQWKSLSTLEVR